MARLTAWLSSGHLRDYHRFRGVLRYTISMASKRFLLTGAIVLSVAILCIVCLSVVYFGQLKSPHSRAPLELTFDPAYYWVTAQVPGTPWIYEEVPAGYKYFLHIPVHISHTDETANLPLVVVFHGSCEKGKAVTYGRFFISDKFQQQFPQGCAVLAVTSRQDYFSDPHSMSRLIQNILIRYTCIDKNNILGWGFSQGAKFVVELSVTEPGLFKGVVSGSGFHQMTKDELRKVRGVQYYWATAKNDAGIYEQGSATGKLVARYCRNSRYVEYEKRGHFFVELTDKTGVGDETALDWITAVLNN